VFDLKSSGAPPLTAQEGHIAGYLVRRRQFSSMQRLDGRDHHGEFSNQTAIESALRRRSPGARETASERLRITPTLSAALQCAVALRGNHHLVRHLAFLVMGGGRICKPDRDVGVRANMLLRSRQLRGFPVRRVSSHCVGRQSEPGRYRRCGRQKLIFPVAAVWLRLP
jgi:hypothetical protein